MKSLKELNCYVEKDDQRNKEQALISDLFSR